MTDGDTPERTEEYRPTLGETSHTNPYTDEPFGATRTYSRGRVVAADGGTDPDRESEEDEAGRDADEETIQDVDHTPPDEGDGAAPAFERGREGKEDVR